MATTARVANGQYEDSTGRNITQEYVNPTYAATIALTPTKQLTTVKVVLTGVATLTAATTAPLIGDEMTVMLIGDTVDRVVTFGTGFSGLATITVSGNSYGSAKFVFNGVKWACASSGTLGVSDIQTPIYAATLSLTTTARSTKLIPGQLTGAMTINAVVTSAVAGDTLEVALATDGTQRIVTFGTNIKSSGTLTIPANKWASVRAIFDGTYWILNGREISA